MWPVPSTQIYYLLGVVKANSMNLAVDLSYLKILPSEIPVYGPLPKESKVMDSGPTEGFGKLSFWNLSTSCGWERAIEGKESRKIRTESIATVELKALNGRNKWRGITIRVSIYSHQVIVTTNIVISLL